MAFRNPNGSLVLVAYNAGDTPAPVTIRFGTRLASTTLPAHAAATLVW